MDLRLKHNSAGIEIRVYMEIGFSVTKETSLLLCIMISQMFWKGKVCEYMVSVNISTLNIYISFLCFNVLPILIP